MCYNTFHDINNKDQIKQARYLLCFADACRYVLNEAVNLQKNPYE